MMHYDAKTPDEYERIIPIDRQAVIHQLRLVIKANLPKGFEEQIQYGMISYVIPHTLYPNGYHVDSKQPLPFMAIASQKNFVALYHMGLYANPELLKWFASQYESRVPSKLDCGKSCIRMKHINQIPYDLIGELCQKMTVDAYIALYETSLNARNSSERSE